MGGSWKQSSNRGTSASSTLKDETTGVHDAQSLQGLGILCDLPVVLNSSNAFFPLSPSPSFFHSFSNPERHSFAIYLWHANTELDSYIPKSDLAVLFCSPWLTYLGHCIKHTSRQLQNNKCSRRHDGVFGKTERIVWDFLEISGWKRRRGISSES